MRQALCAGVAANGASPRPAEAGWRASTLSRRGEGSNKGRLAIAPAGGWRSERGGGRVSRTTSAAARFHLGTDGWRSLPLVGLVLVGALVVGGLVLMASRAQDRLA